VSINGVQDRDTLWIGGDWVPSDGGGTIEVISPHTEQVIATVPEASNADIDQAVVAARNALETGPWATMDPAGRGEILADLTAGLGARAEDLAQTITAEMGSPIMFSHLGQVGATLMVADYYANLVKDFAFEEERQGMMSSVLVRREPVGVVGAIVPWNVPLYVTMLKLAPALAAGATMVLKPAPESPLSAYLLAEALEEAGVPKGVVSILPAGREVGEHLVRHPGVDKIAFTGSTAAGMKIASLCGEQLKRYTLELGGKSAAIILDDADVDTTLDSLLQVAGLMNSGQACVAQTRVLASKAKYDEVVNGLATRMEAVKVGDPAEMDTEVGPLVAERQRDRVEKYIVQGQEEGAEVIVGGGRPAGQDTGWYVEPTLFAKVTNDMRIAQEEIFGPVISAIAFEDVDDAVRIANDSSYGLSGSVWTADGAGVGLDVAKRIRTGTFNVNGFMLEPCAPFGGFKQSGVGREGGPEGLAAYLEDKAINRF
jgi:betaine-aldehyde dehydrogenase